MLIDILNNYKIKNVKESEIKWKLVNKIVQ